MRDVCLLHGRQRGFLDIEARLLVEDVRSSCAEWSQVRRRLDTFSHTSLSPHRRLRSGPEAPGQRGPNPHQNFAMTAATKGLVASLLLVLSLNTEGSQLS